MPSYTKYQTKQGVRWSVRWDVTDPLTKRRRQPSKRPFRTRSAAVAWYEQHIAGKTRVSSSTTPIAEYVDAWLAGRRLSDVATRTYQYGARSIAAHLGHIRLRDLTRAHVRAWHTAMLADGYAPRTISTYHAVLHGALEQAVDDNLIYANPARRVKIPQPDRSARPHWSAEQIDRFLAATDGDWTALPYRIMVQTGLRPGECRALRWSDLDLRRRTLTVPDSKTPAGVRTFAIPSRLTATLRAWRNVQIERRLEHPDWTDHDLVITSPARGGYPCSAPYLIHQLDRYCEHLNLPRITPHGLRHSCSTWLAALGVHPIIVQQMLGHAHITETLATYTHASAAMSRQAADAIDAACASDVHRVELKR